MEMEEIEFTINDREQVRLLSSLLNVLEKIIHETLDAEAVMADLRILNKSEGLQTWLPDIMLKTMQYISEQIVRRSFDP